MEIDSSIRALLNKMLKDVHNLFGHYKLFYFIDATTLLSAVRHRGLAPWLDVGDFTISFKQRDLLLSLEGRLNEMGYGLTEYWGGYKIWSFAGKNIKYWNRAWHPYESSQILEDRETFDYKYPFIKLWFGV